jgi:hypothetical protein
MYKLYVFSRMLRRWVPAVGAPEFGYPDVIQARRAARQLQRYWGPLALYIRYPLPCEIED